MTWARIDDRFHSHPKVASLGPYMLACVGLHTLALSWSTDQLTDGAIPADQVARLAGDLTLLLPKGRAHELVERLLAVGMWEEMDGGYRIHDFLDYNPSKASIVQLRRIRAKAGQAGGLAKSQQTAGKDHSKPLANGKQTASKPNPLSSLSPRPPITTSPLPAPDPAPDPETKAKTKTGTSASRAVLGNGDFIAALQANVAYKAIDIDKELGKLDAWLLTPRGRGKRKTRGRIVAWLNRALEDLPLESGAWEEKPYGFER